MMKSKPGCSMHALKSKYQSGIRKKADLNNTILNLFQLNW